MTTDTFFAYLLDGLQKDNGFERSAAFDEHGAARLAVELTHDGSTPFVFCPITFVAWILGCGVYDLNDVIEAGAAFGLTARQADDIQDAADYPDTSHQDLRTQILDILALPAYEEE